jgi:hypothetical protein
MRLAGQVLWKRKKKTYTEVSFWHKADIDPTMVDVRY